MEFNPNNAIVKLCIQGMDMEMKGTQAEALAVFMQAWNEAGTDFEQFLAAYYVARNQPTVADRLHWYHIALQHATAVQDDTIQTAYPALHENIAKCYEEMNDAENAKKHQELAALYKHTPADKGPFYHGTRADLKVGDELIPGFTSNYQDALQMNHIYFTALPNAAGLAAALAKGEGAERVYIVEPTDGFESDPNVTDKKFPGNPTRSYRTTAPLKIVGELHEWVRQTPEQIQMWRDRLAQSTGEIIN